MITFGIVQDLSPQYSLELGVLDWQKVRHVMAMLELGRIAAFVVGGFQILANLFTLLRGPIRIRQEFAAGAISERFADLLSISWVYGSAASLCLSFLLILLASEIGRANT